MGCLRDTINTVPGVSVYAEGSVQPEKQLFIAYISEGQEESQYLEIVSRGNPRIIDVLKHYENDSDRVSLSHPKHRYEALIEFLDLKDLGYVSNLDKAFLITDRDSQNFKEDQYDKLLALCETNGIEWIVSNPAFQLWLLFHFTDDITAIEKETKTKKQILVIEQLLRRLCGRYQHGILHKEDFASKIDSAMKNAERYCHTAEELKDKIGTRFPVLIKHLRGIVS